MNPSPTVQNTNTTPATRNNLKLWQALACVAAGVVLTLVVAMIGIALFVGVPATNVPLNQPPASGKSDVTATVSQEYVNREVATLLQKNPVSILAVGSVNEAVIYFNTDGTVSIVTRLKALGRQIDIKIKDKPYVKDNKLGLTLAEDPTLEGLLPLGILKGAVNQVNDMVATQLNGLITSVGLARDCTTGKPIGRVPTLQSFNLQSGVLVAQFSVAINS